VDLHGQRLAAAALDHDLTGSTFVSAARRSIEQPERTLSAPVCPRRLVLNLGEGAELDESQPP
jgi:hypothetical protein